MQINLQIFGESLSDLRIILDMLFKKIVRSDSSPFEDASRVLTARLNFADEVVARKSFKKIDA